MNSRSFSHYQYVSSPSFENEVKSATYFTSNHALVRVINDTKTTSPVNPDIILENEHADSPTSTNIRYRAAIYWDSTYTNTYKYMRFYIP